MTGPNNEALNSRVTTSTTSVYELLLMLRRLGVVCNSNESNCWTLATSVAWRTFYLKHYAKKETKIGVV